MKAGLGSMSRRWLLNAIWLALGGGMIAIATLRMISGLATESAFPVPIYMFMNVPVPEVACRAASQRLAHASQSDGDSKIAQAEASACAGGGSITIALEQGLSLSPASARGWMLLAEQNLQSNPKRAAQALTMSLELDEFPYWLVVRRVRDASSVWSVMSETGKKDTFKQVRLLWETSYLRPRIEPLLAQKGVAAIFSQAYAGDPDSVRAINRWRAESNRQQSF